jgi:hypothetical protein
MPFAGYKDFNDCVRKNRNKRDPKAYCAAIMRDAEKAGQSADAGVESSSKETAPRQHTGWWRGHL